MSTDWFDILLAVLAILALLLILALAVGLVLITWKAVLL